jgi:AsmA protein
MKRVHRWWLAGGIVLVVLPLLAVLAVMLLIDPNRFRGPLESAARERFGLTLQLRGDLRWQWWPLLTVASDAGQIVDPGSGAPLIDWSRLELGARWSGLRQNQFVIDSIRVTAPGLRLHRAADGRGNWQVLVEGLAQRTPTIRDAGAAAATGSIELRSLIVRSARIDFDDAVNDRRWRATGLNIETAVTFDRSARSLQLRDLTVDAQLGGAELPQAGIAVELAAPQLRYDNLAGSVTAPTWRLQVGTLRIDGKQSEPLQLSPLRGAGQLTLRTESTRALLATLDIEAPPTRDDDLLGALSAELNWQLTAERLDLQPLRIKADDTQFEGLAMWPLDDPAPALLELRGDQIDFDRYLRPEDQPGEPFELPVETLRALDLEGQVSFDTAQLFGVTMRGARFLLHSDRGLAAVTRQR